MRADRTTGPKSHVSEPLPAVLNPLSLEAALVHSEQRYRSLFEESRDAIYITRLDGSFIDANTSFLELFGCTRAELLHINARELYADPLERNRFRREVEAKRAVRDFEVKLRTRHGRIIDCLLSSSVHIGPEGELLWYQGIIHDITARKRVEAALAESEHFASTMVSSVGEGIIVYDRDLRYQVWNRFMEELTGLSAKQVIGHSAHELFPVLREYGAQELLQAALAGETGRSGDAPYNVPETGRFGWVTALYSPHVAPDGEIIGVVAIIHDVTERKRAEEQLVHNAFHDALTGLPNRALFMDRLERLIRHVQRNPAYSYAVLFLDLDRFKVVNDSLGHVFGDELLVAIGRRLADCIRQGDTVARLGGDEFAILLDEIHDLNDATHIADRIEQELTAPFTLHGHEVFTSASIGIALSTTGYVGPEEVLRDADTAMYRAKNDGRARYEVFDRTMHAQAVEQLEVETDLRRAIERDEFVLHYQPIVSLVTGQLDGFEALARWQHAKHGLVMPADFIPIAEETGLIVPMGYAVLRTACSQMNDWLRSFPLATNLTVSVNLSSRQFGQPDLVQQIDAILASTGCPPANLKLEITESTVMRDAAQAAEMLQQLRSRGINLCIDDFGTGYSSLSYLNSFPVDTLKIDRSFIARLDEDSSSVDLVEIIVALCRVLGMSAVAEGIETREQLELVRRLGSQLAQGYYVSTPLPVAEASRVLAEGLDFRS